MSKDLYREKFRPDDSALQQEVEAALADVSLDTLLDGGPDAPRQAPATGATPGGKGPRKGRIVSITKEAAFVDLGGKSQGIVDLLQFETFPNVGDEMEFHVERYLPDEGLIQLNLRGAVNSKVTWENLEVGQIVEGTVSALNKGGLEVEVKGMRAFMPSGQVELYFNKDLSTYIGQKLTAEVTQFDRERKNLILSRRNILEREKEEAKQKLLAELAEGQVRRGTVRSVQPYGAFVDLGGVDGLLHVSEISHKRVRDPNELIKEGDIVDVKITRIDKETGKLSLSLKQAMADPWTDAAARYAIGSTLTGRVSHVEAFGAFVEAEEGLEGLLPMSEMSWQRIRHPSDMVKDGDTLKVVVIALDVAARRMTFSLKQAGGDPWSGVEDRFPVHSVVSGKVTRTADFGAFVELEAGLEGLVHISELSGQRVRTTTDVVKPGQEVKVLVLEVDKDKRRIGLSIRRANEAAAAPAPTTAAGATPAASVVKKKRPVLRGGLDF